MDFSKVARELEIKESEYFELLQMFEQHCRTDLDTLGKALRELDLQTLHSAAHSIKGASGSLFLTQIHEAASEICICATDGEIDPLTSLASVIRTKLDEISVLLNERRGGEGNEVGP